MKNIDYKEKEPGEKVSFRPAPSFYYFFDYMRMNQLLFHCCHSGEHFALNSLEKRTASG